MSLSYLFLRFLIRKEKGRTKELQRGEMEGKEGKWRRVRKNGKTREGKGFEMEGKEREGK